MKLQRYINHALAFAVFGVIFNGVFWGMAARARTTPDGARSWVVFGAGIGIAMAIAAWQFQAKGIARRGTDTNRSAARVVRIIVAFHILIAVVTSIILLVALR